MRYVFFGSPRFAEIVLRKLTDAGQIPVAVVCNPDRPVGRRRLVTPPPTKILAGERGIEVIQPEKLKPFAPKLRALGADLYVVAAYARIIPQDILDIPARGAIGVHPSLLPLFRGASPIQSALLAGDARTGVTLYLMDAETDHGPVIAVREVALPPDATYETLHDELATLGGELLLAALPAYLSGTIEPAPQEHAQATFTKKIIAEDAYVDPDELAAAERGADPAVAMKIDRMIRALNPEPGTWTVRHGKRVKLLAARLDDPRLVLTRTQAEGERPRESRG